MIGVCLTIADSKSILPTAKALPLPNIGKIIDLPNELTPALKPVYDLTNGPENPPTDPDTSPLDPVLYTFGGN